VTKPEQHQSNKAQAFDAPAPIVGRQRLAWALLLAALSSIGPFAIDTYLPAFEGIASSLQATPLQMQQSLSIYLIAFAVITSFMGRSQLALKMDGAEASHLYSTTRPSAKA